MVASDGGVFSFGDAKFYGSMGGTRLNKPVMSLAPDPDGVGYWLVASDGGIFAFQATFFGSMGGTRLNKPVSGMVGQPGGYLMVAEDGGIFTFGAVDFHGSLGASPPPSPVVSVAAIPKPPPKTTVTVSQASGNTVEYSSSTFMAAATTATMSYSCQRTSGSLAGCRFALYRLNGDFVDSVSPDPGSTGTHYFHPEGLDEYYVQVSLYGDGAWSYQLTQNVDAPLPSPSPEASVTVSEAQGSSEYSSPPFTLGSTGTMTYSCQPAGSLAGCRFAVYTLGGDFVDSVSPDPGETGIHYFHPDSPGQHYVQVSLYGNGTWSYQLSQAQ
jgi:hypothetical protein